LITPQRGPGLTFRPATECEYREHGWVRRFHYPEGLEIDWDTHRFWLNGLEMVVGHCIVSDEAAYLTLLAGENGWWVDLRLDRWTNTIQAGMDDLNPQWVMDDTTPYEVERLWRFATRRKDAVSDHEAYCLSDGEWTDGFGGVEPGTWVTDYTIRTPEELAEIEAWVRQLVFGSEEGST
jgi:hypothetical protein